MCVACVLLLFAVQYFLVALSKKQNHNHLIRTGSEIPFRYNFFFLYVSSAACVFSHCSPCYSEVQTEVDQLLLPCSSVSAILRD